MSAKWGKARVFTRTLSDAAGAVAGACVFILLIIVLVSVLCRYLFNRPLLFGDEVAGYMMAGVVLLGLAYTARVGGHISVEIITRKLRPRVATILQFATTIIALGWALPILIGSILTWEKHFSQGSLGYGTIDVPLWIPLLCLVAGAAILLLELIGEIIEIALSMGIGPKEDKHG